MKKFSLSILLLTVLFTSPVQAQEEFVPPLYCVGTGGADCSSVTGSGAPMPSPVITAKNQPQTQPCVPEQSNSNFLINFFMRFFSFFQSDSGKKPCPPRTPAPTSIPVVTNPQPSSIQLIDRKVAQVGGEEMSLTVEKPQNAQAEDILIAMIGSDYAHVDDIPSGWVLIRQDVKNAGHTDDLALQSYYKIVTANEEASYTWNLVTGRKDTPSEHQPLIAVDLYAFRGVDPNNPILSNDVRGETKDPKAIECPSVKGISGGMLLCAYIGDDPGSITAPNSMTQTSNFEIAGGDTYAIAYETLTSGNDTGPRMAAWDNPEKGKNGSDFAHAIVLRPLL